MKQLNRWVYAIVGVIVLLFAGLVYAWSVLSTPIGAEFTGWTKAQLSLTFTLVMILFCIGSLLCGLLAGRLSAKNAVRLGAVLFLAGFFIASRCQSPLTLYLGFGVLCGLGSGLSYNAVMSTMVRWFPDRPGLISGVLLMGYGASSLVLGSLAAKLIATPGFGWHLTYILTGALLLAAAFIGLPFILPPKQEADVRTAAPSRGLTPRQMLRTKRFYLFFAAAVIGTGYGSGLIAHARYIFLEGGAPEATATLAVGLVSVMNGLGRIIFGMLHDRCGFRVSLLADALLYIAAGAVAALSLGGSYA